MKDKEKICYEKIKQKDSKLNGIIGESIKLPHVTKFEEGATMSIGILILQSMERK